MILYYSAIILIIIMSQSVHLRGIGHATKQDSLWLSKSTGITACAHLAKILWTGKKLQALGSSYSSLHNIADWPKKFELGLTFFPKNIAE